MLTRYRPQTFTSPLSLFNAFFDARDPFSFAGSFESGPRFSLNETDDAYTLTGDLPGVRAEDLNVTIEDGVLIVRGHRNVEPPEGYEVRRSERSRLAFERSYALGDRIDADGAEAKLDDGVLTLTLPKRAEAKPRQITIQSA